MDFNNRLYELRKQKGLSQEELANKLNVSRQTVSKWEIGDTTPDMEKLISLSQLFEVSLDQLILGKVSTKSSLSQLEVKLNTEENKRTLKKILKIVVIIFAVFFVVDFIAMILYFFMHGTPN